MKPTKNMYLYPLYFSIAGAFALIGIISAVKEYEAGLPKVGQVWQYVDNDPFFPKREKRTVLAIVGQRIKYRIEVVSADGQTTTTSEASWNINSFVEGSAKIQDTP